MIHNLLSKYEFFFNRIIGDFKTKPIDIELQPFSKLHHAKPYLVTRSHKSVFKK